MILTINAPQFDIDGHVIAEGVDPAGLDGFSRRVSRVATLDGGAAINDFGYSVADRTLTITWRPRNLAQVENIRRMVQSYGRLIVSFSDGCFLGAPEQFTPNDDNISLTVLIEERLNA